MPTCGRLFALNIRIDLLHASEFWDLKINDLCCFERNGRSMIRSILNFRVEDKTTIQMLY